ncbi:hypothetical protein SAMN05660900_02328 [Megasphaera cerevisiae DSM 20462]|nr:hypothetical protein SAMN05660900_02328 [Megasphaera cerevisiae DSM 20462]
MDNLNTHTIASLYQTFELRHAFELVNRLEIHFTPKHGSWLDKGQCCGVRYHRNLQSQPDQSGKLLAVPVPTSAE